MGQRQFLRFAKNDNVAPRAVTRPTAGAAGAIKGPAQGGSKASHHNFFFDFTYVYLFIKNFKIKNLKSSKPFNFFKYFLHTAVLRLVGTSVHPLHLTSFAP